jgi:hypothetical protein
MKVSYILHLPLWSRIKLLFGLGLRVEAEALHNNELNINTCVEGEENKLTTIYQFGYNND